MTAQEQKSIDQLLKVTQELRQENVKFREDITKQVDSINNKTDKKYLPVYLEQDILQVAQQAVNDSVKAVLTQYGSPLHKLVASVVDEHSTELRAIISDSFSQVIKKEEFKQSIVNAFSHKVARTIISNNDGLFDKVSNELKQDAVFKSKMAIAVSNVVEECLTNKP